MTLPNNQIRPLIRQGWEQVAGEYARDRLGIFGRCAARLLDWLEPVPTDYLLDVGTGCGAVAWRAADRLGVAGLAVGSDIAATMVYLARQHVSPASRVFFCQADAERLSFPDRSFDAVTCAFSLFQFPQMEQALAEMRRVLKPGGRLGLSNWGPGYFSPIASLQRDLFREFGLKALLPNPLTFKPAELRSLLERAGFTGVRLIEETETVWFRDAAQVWAFNLDMGPFPVMLQQQLSADRQQELAQRFIELLKDLMTERGIESTFHLLYALAERGGDTASH